MLNFESIEAQISSQVIAGKTSGCMFCDVDGGLILAQTDNFYLIRDRYPILEGHLMVISKGHYGCMGEIPIPLFNEIEALRGEAEAYYEGKKYIVYEHGRAGHCVKLSGSQVTCHHFHLHFVPLDVNIHPVLIERYVAKKTTSTSHVPELYNRFGEYLYFENSLREGFYYPATQHVESHLLRTLVCIAADLVHRSDWEVL